jgi:conjugal transfer pilus assembly protein TraD
MTPRPHPSRSARVLALLVCVVLLTSPPAWAAIALGAAAIGAMFGLEIRTALRHRRAPLAPVAPGIALGSDRDGQCVLLSDHQLSAHALILGASGSGKSTTLLTLLTDYVRKGRPVVAIDMKGSPAFARALRDAADAAGRPFALWTPDGPSAWNPLAHGNPTELKDKLIATERFTEPHYQRAAERYMQTVLQAFRYAQPHAPPTLEQVVGMMDPRRLPGLLRYAPRPFADRVQDYLAGLPPDQLSAIRGLATRLAIITEAHTGAFLGGGAAGRPGSGAVEGTAGGAAGRSGGGAAEGPAATSPGAPTIDVRAALAGDQVVLFSLNSSTYGKLSAQLGALAIQDLVAAAGHRLAQPAHGGQAIIGIDEFSALDSDNVISLLARCREAQVSVLLSTQELADLDRSARGLRDQVLGSTAVKIAHRQEVPASARTIAQMAGTETVWEESVQTTRHPLLGLRESGRGTRRPTDRFRVHPDEISSLPPGQAVLITKLPGPSVSTVRVTPPQRQGPER